MRARTADGALAAGTAVIVTGGGLASSGSPLRDRLTVTSSHMAITEPVPDLLEPLFGKRFAHVAVCRRAG